MFTPQRKGWSSGWSLSPRVGEGLDNGSANARSVSGVSFGKGKGKGVEALPPPPQASLGENGGVGGAGGSGDVEVWRRFRDEGLLDESILQKKDREALVWRVTELEKELHEYQYNMGLLLIEKKEWSSENEEIRQRLAEAEEILKREQAAHLIAISELDKREENMRKALGVEKQCVTDLEKALREMRAEIAEVKFTSDRKLAEAHALEASLEEKYLEVGSKLHSADAKLAEASRKSSEIDRKLEDVEARERKLQRDYLSLNAERKAHEKDVSEQREHLRDWERKLQEGQKRLVDGQRYLNEREDRANETDRVLKKKEEELEEARRMIEATKNSLKNSEDDISIRLNTLAAQEKDADVRIKLAEKKEKDLLEIEEKLNAREREEIQKLLDNHNAILDSKKQEFEMEMENKRKSFNEEMKSKLDVVGKQENEINSKEEQVCKREQALESKMEKVKNKEKDLDTKSKALKKWEESIKSDEKKLVEEKQQLAKISQELVVSRAELESLRAAINAGEQKIIEEKANLKITKEEREQHVKLQSELKEEIEECRMIKEALVKEREALRKEREKFEREWEVLDEKRMTLEAEAKKVNEEKDRFEKWRHNEQERLKNEVLQGRADIQRELEVLRSRKEAFENTMEHERSEAREEVKRELADVERELELRKHNLEMNMQKRREEMEKKLQEKENELDREREVELGRINSSISLNDSKIQKLKVDQDRLEKEKEDLSIHRKKLEDDQVEIQKDIDTLRMLSRKLKDQREEFIKERERFLAAAQQCKTCHNCGVPLSELELIGLQPSEDADVLLPGLPDGYLEEYTKGKKAVTSPPGAGSQSVNSGGRMSWLKKCSRLFKISPVKKIEHSNEGQAGLFSERLEMAATEDEANYEPALSYGVANYSFDTQRAQSDSATRDKEEPERFGKAGDEQESSLGVADNSFDIPSIGEQNEIEGYSIPPEVDSKAPPSRQRRRQPSRKGRPKRTRTMKQVVEESKAILGENSDMKMDGDPNGDNNDSRDIHEEESQGASVHAADQVATNTRQKRRRPQASGMTTSELDAEDSEARSDSVSVGGGRYKRRQTTAPGGQIAGEKRYNLRRSKVAGTVAAAQATVDQNKGHKAQSDHPVPEDEVLKGGQGGDGASNHGVTASPSSGFLEENNRSTNTLQKTTEGVVMEIHEITSQKLVRFESREVGAESDDNVIRSVELTDGSKEDGDEVNGAATTNEPATPSNGSDDDEDEEDDEKGDASIGKKLWNFFTT